MLDNNLKEYVTQLVMLKYLLDNGYLDFKEYFKIKIYLKKKNNIQDDDLCSVFSENAV